VRIVLNTLYFFVELTSSYMLHHSLYAVIFQSRALLIGLPALSSVRNTLLRPLGCRNAASLHVIAAAGSAGAAHGHAGGASRCTPGSSAATAAAPQLAASTGGPASSNNWKLMKAAVPIQLAIGSSSSSSSSSSSWVSWLGFAAAGVLVQAGVVSHADAAAGPSDPVSGSTCCLQQGSHSSCFFICNCLHVTRQCACMMVLQCIATC
jgi:hypothetical protein